MKTLAEQVKEFMDWRSQVDEKDFTPALMAAAIARHQSDLPEEKRCTRQNIEGLLSKGLQTPRYLVALAKAMGSTAEILKSGKFVAGSSRDKAAATNALDAQSNVSEIERRAKVPLISLIQAGELTDVCDLLISVEACQWVEPIYTHPSSQSYALRVEGDSMESPIPGTQTFLEGTILIVDPNASCGPNDYVIAKDVTTQKATFKKLTTDGVRWYLKPLNSIYPTVEIDDPALRVIGKVVEFQPPGGKL